MSADPTHRHDQMHRGQVPTGQLADGTATAGDAPLSNGDGTVTWGSSVRPDRHDEGTPLATAATSIDFVGAGVTASGSGAAEDRHDPRRRGPDRCGRWRPVGNAAQSRCRQDHRRRSYRPPSVGRRRRAPGAPRHGRRRPRAVRVPLTTSTSATSRCPVTGPRPTSNCRPRRSTRTPWGPTWPGSGSMSRSRERC